MNSITSPRRPVDIPEGPEAEEHAREAERIRQDLQDHGVTPEVVAPTRDRRGFVRLAFQDIDTLLGKLYSAGK